MLARLSCWKALFAAPTGCVISASKVQSEVKTLPLQCLLKWIMPTSGVTHADHMNGAAGSTSVSVPCCLVGL